MIVGLSLALGWLGVAQAQVDLSALDKDMAGPRAQVLVLGSVHLSEMAKGFQPESLELVLERLAAFKPEIITIEAISGESCDLMARHPTVYGPERISPYCGKTDEARAATGLDVPAAIAAVSKTLADWPTQPGPAARRHLAALFLAANEPTSALTQWLQLAEAERRVGNGLDDALVVRLDKLATSNSEDSQIAARLAARLGLQRVFPVDDHTGDNAAIPDAEVGAYANAIRQAWKSAEAQTQPLRQHEDELKKNGDLLALYRYINRPDVRRVQADSDFGAAMREASPGQYAQIYVAGWETRNLRMVANIRAAFREQPGARVLSIVGASHKPWFDSLLGQMQGVDIVNVETVLRPPSG
ncbi:hypothetical protein INQ41_02310 [Lysobacter ciconiae]|uniref:Uncharacterized protein n=1 Tax=Novilysobacter ciconiae TaxID=2781022 RepID=A0A7S6UIA1_9GAMM|nr:DUF5694 domain-containing protein [Lysobacter ciconiae]QOW20730.1 hypothetical protein INQ41_02310 [Lysobacter ciconiae]